MMSFKLFAALAAVTLASQPEPASASPGDKARSASLRPTKATAQTRAKAATASAAAGASNGRRDIWGATWKPTPGDCELLTPMIFLDGEFKPGRVSSAPPASTYAAKSRSVPNGRAAILWWRYSNSLFAFGAEVSDVRGLGTQDAHPWDTAAVSAVQREWSGWLRDYRAAGGRMDYLIGDCERWGMFRSWSLDHGDVTRIVADPRMNSSVFGVAPLRQLIGNIDYSKVVSPGPSGEYLRWNLGVGTIAAAAMREAIWGPAMQHFPMVRGSNFAGIHVLDRPAPDLNGHAQPESNIFGTAHAPVAYGQMECVSTAWFIDEADPTRLARSGSERLVRGAWGSFLLDVQAARACARNDATRPLQPWIALQAWPGDRPGSVGYVAEPVYYDEMVKHLALHRAEVFLYWNPNTMPQSSGGGHAPWSASQHEDCARRLNSVLRDVNSKTHGVVAEAATLDPLSFRSAIAMSGAKRHDGKWIWRTTVSPAAIGLRWVKSGAAAPFESGTRGRWDVTDGPIPPRLVPVLREGSLVRGEERR